MKLISWNVNGIRAVWKKGFSQWLLQENPDVLCLQETKASVDQLSAEMTTVGEYSSFWCSAEKKGYSGVAIYTKKRPLSVTTGLGLPEFDSEGRVIIADFGSFVLFNVYFPNGGAGNKRVSFKMAFYTAFEQKVESLRRQGRQVVICGDVNTAHEEIDLARPKENSKNTGFLPEERAWVSRLISLGYIDTFRSFYKEGGHYSWWDYKTAARVRNVGWRIDYFFISAALKPALSGAFILSEVQGSDHCPVGINLKEEI